MRHDHPTPEAVTAQQLRFAEHHAAVIGTHSACDGSLVFVYRDDDAGTKRWLVDKAGHVLESERFRRP
jgi:hypothetical protein